MGAQDPENTLGVSFIHFELLDGDGGVRPYDAPLPPLVHEFLDIHYVDAVMRRVVELRAESGACATTLFTGLLMDLDARSDRAPVAPRSSADHYHREVVFRLASRIGEQPGQVPPVAELARNCGYTADHFTRVFKQVLGLTPRDFIVRARLERARHLLAESSLKVAQIASELGYSDVYFFSKQFKQKTGRSPTEFRKRSG